MANEINANVDATLTGRTLEARIVAQGGAQVGVVNPLAEVARPTHIVFTGDMPAGLPAGIYSIEFVDVTSTPELITLGCIVWDGLRESLISKPAANTC